jgi:hypothetical protein
MFSYYEDAAIKCPLYVFLPFETKVCELVTIFKQYSDTFTHGLTPAVNNKTHYID